MRLRPSLFTRILLWSFLYLAGVGTLLYGFFAFQFRLDPDSVLFAGNRLQYVVARLSTESRSAPTVEARDELFERYSAAYGVDFLLYNDEGIQVAGPTTTLPPGVLGFIRDERGLYRGPRNPGDRQMPGRAGAPGPSGLPGPPSGAQAAPTGPQAPATAPGQPGTAAPAADPMLSGAPPSGAPRGGPFGDGRPAFRQAGPQRSQDSTAGRPLRLPDAFRLGNRGQRGVGGPGQPIFRERTSDPSHYWVGMRLPLFEPGERRPAMFSLVVSSDSMWGRGLFFDARPWVFVSAAIVLLSIAIWFPFVRGLTRSIGQMTATAEEMARGQFDVRVQPLRSDEIGRLGAAINQLSSRLGGFVGGQRRFLGDISHELNSPLARLDVALGIVEERVAEQDREMVNDAQEEVRLMSELVAELLAFAKAGMKGQEVRLSPVPLKPVCEAVASREAQGREVVVDVAPDVTVVAQPQLLARALANLVRNAVRYAGDAGPITLAARPIGGEMAVTVSDRGPGVPPETIPRLFEPFFRIEADRDRATGGAGLGLAIVKTCVDACQGRVEARNLSPGFAVEIRLAATG